MFKNKLYISAPARLCFVICLFAFSVFAQKIPAPAEVIGFTPGDDRRLASWQQVVDYFKKLDAASTRVRFEEIGKSTLERPFVYATISAPENLRNLAKYKAINAKLADPRWAFRLRPSPVNVAPELIKEGKTIVLITCGIHSTEVGSTLSSMLIAHRLATSNEPEIQKILQNTIILLVPSLNPDGVDIVKNWYDKTLGTPFEGTSPPELYHKYVGHDNNRDWYAFTQAETKLTVEYIHNEWHPQIVHDIHQQGERGSRLFLPPYHPPVEPNVPKEIVAGYTELGSFMANDLRQKGFQGITTNSTYDAWTPARAYSHYHGGVRILSETASARIASPVTIKFEDLRGGLGYDARTESANFSPVWRGGEWKLRDITNYMTAASFSLLRHASENREQWLSRFLDIGKEAVRPRKQGELWGFKIESEDTYALTRLKWILSDAGVEHAVGKPVKITDYLPPPLIVKMAQPYGAFAKTILEKQAYPKLLNAAGEPVAPYDVTAHTLSLLMNVKVEPLYAPHKTFRDDILSAFDCAAVAPPTKSNGFVKIAYKQTEKLKTALYRSHIPSMDEGWTRWVFEKEPCPVQYESLKNKEIQAGQLNKFKTIVFPDQTPNQILNGYAKGAMPDEYTGGVGKEGVKSLRKFVETGGTLIFLNRASDFAIRELGLPVRDVTEGLNRKDFYIPGSILRTEINTAHKIAKEMPAESIAWFEDSPVFEITDSDDTNVEIIARYPRKPENILLSGWALGAEKIAGKAALVSINIGKGKIILFGFRPQYRAQSLATFPLLFNAIGN